MTRAGSFLDIDHARASFRVHRDAYRDREVFAREMKLIFERCWLYLGHASEVDKPGDYATRCVAQRDIIFMHTRAEGVHAFYNTCTHRGVTLCRDKRGSAKVLTCPYHGWVFNTSGQWMNTEAEKYPASFNSDGRYNLRRVERLEEYRGFYFVNFDQNAVSLRDYLAGAAELLDLIADQSPAGLTLIGQPHEYSIPANYKYLAENSFDAYHGVPTHSSYFEFLNTRLGDSEQQARLDEIMKDYAKGGLGAGLGNGHGLFEGWLPNGKPVASWIPPWGPEAKVEIDRIRRELKERFGEARMRRICDHQKNVVIFPNLVINDHVAITIRSFQPEGVDRMRVTAWAAGPKDELRMMRKIRLDNFLTFLGPAGFATPDDNEMLALAQRGASHTPVEWIDFSRDMPTDPSVDMLTSRGAWTDEHQLRAYWLRWDQMMNGASGGLNR